MEKLRLTSDAKKQILAYTQCRQEWHFFGLRLPDVRAAVGDSRRPTVAASSAPLPPLRRPKQTIQNRHERDAIRSYPAAATIHELSDFVP
jgi:hypothetical protein